MKRAPYYLMFFLSVGVSAYAAVAYGLFEPGALVHPDMRPAFEARAAALRLHIFASILALALGPLQFSAALRARRPRVHRMVGKMYLAVGVGIGGLSGLYLAQEAFGGAIARAGFATLALAWLYTGVQGYLAVRRRDIARHLEWMVRNFALTFAAVTLRIYLPSSMVAGIPFEVAYPVIAWLCWVPNLVAANLWIRSGALESTHEKRPPGPGRVPRREPGLRTATRP